MPLRSSHSKNESNPRPNFNAMLDLDPHTVINELPPEEEILTESGEQIFYRTACIGRLALNLAQGKYEINAEQNNRSIFGKKRDIHLVGERRYAEDFAQAKYWPGAQLPKKHQDALRDLSGRNFKARELPRIVMSVALPANSPKLELKSPSDGRIYRYHDTVGFDAVDEQSRKALEDLLGVQLPSKKP